MLVKICGITTEGDALLAVALGADAVGFIFAPSPRQVSVQAVTRIVERLPREILTVGVFRNELPQRVVEVVNGIGLRAAQLHGGESVADTRWVAERVPLTIKAFPAGHPRIREFPEYGAGAVLVDGANPGSGQVFDWRLAEGVVDPARLIVSGGLHAGNVADAVAHLRPMGVDVASGVESVPGKKDPQKLRAFLAAARQAEQECGDPGGVAGLLGTGALGGSALGDGGPAGKSLLSEDGTEEEAPYNWEMDG